MKKTIKHQKKNIEKTKACAETEGNISGKIKKMILLLLMFLPVIFKFQIVEFVSPTVEFNKVRTNRYGELMTNTRFDFFMIMMIVIIVLFIWYLAKNKLRINIYDYCIFSLIAVFSIIPLFSDYKMIALFGTYNRKESSIFYIFALILCWIVSKLRLSEKDLRKIIFSFGAFLIFNIILNTLYHKGVRILEIENIKKIILFGYDDINIRAGSYVISSLRNPNYLSGFMGVLASLFAGVVLFSRDRVAGAVSAVFYLTAIYLMFGADSSSGFVSFVLILPILLYGVFRFRGKLEYAILAAIVAIFALVGKMVAVKIPKVMTEVMGMVSKLELKYILAYLACFAIIFLMGWILRKYEIKNTIIVTLVAVFVIGGVFFIPHSEYYYKDYPQNIKTYDEIKKELSNRKIELSVFTGRGYIWKRTFDLIKENPLGYGLGTLNYKYPQGSIYDVTYKQILDKPHNHYLEILYGGGIFALIAYLVLLLKIFIESMRTKDQTLYMFLPAFMAFLFQNIINDSVLSTYPIYMVLIGIMINKITNSKEKMEEENA